MKRPDFPIKCAGTRKNPHDVEIVVVVELVVTDEHRPKGRSQESVDRARDLTRRLLRDRSQAELDDALGQIIPIAGLPADRRVIYRHSQDLVEDERGERWVGPGRPRDVARKDGRRTVPGVTFPSDGDSVRIKCHRCGRVRTTTEEALLDALFAAAGRGDALRLKDLP